MLTKTTDSHRISNPKLQRSVRAYFARRDGDLMQLLRDELEGEASRAALSRATGITDEQVLGHLVSQGVSPETAVDIGLIPLIYVAWADGVVDLRERTAILQAATEFGVSRGTPAFDLLTHWLRERPDEQLLKDWVGYVRDVVSQFAPTARAAVRKDVLTRAEKIARAAGGVMGLGCISPAELAAMRRLEEAFKFDS